ncbi:MAG TPA: S1 RNA-binding domain-containing protein [bacterium]|nr:S1 RNA-binding domain-containing protein [bacterium]
MIDDNARPDPGDDVDLARMPSLTERQIVQGTVVRVDSEGVLVDVGAKSEGFIPPKELSARGDAVEGITVGDKIDVYVMKVEGEEGNILLSKKRADLARTWDRVQDAHRQGTVLHAMVVDKVKGGLVVDLGLRGFVPGSHVDLSEAKGRQFESLVGQSIPLKVIEVDRGKGRVILSHKTAVAEQRTKRRGELLTSLEEGEIREGIVRRLTDFGAFVDIGGVDALLPISEMSWTYIKHPSEVVRRGQHLKVAVLRIDREAGRISLGLKHILPDPWQHIGETYRPGQTVTGKVVRIVASGAFVRLGEVDAFLPISELADKRVGKVEDVLAVGQNVETLVTEIRSEERRMILSLKRLARARERQQVKEYISSQEPAGRVTIGDIAGDLLRRAVTTPGRDAAEGEAGSSEAPARDKNARPPETREPAGDAPASPPDTAKAG